EPENFRVDCPKNRNTQTGQCVCRTCLRPCRFKDEPKNHRGDSKRNRAEPKLTQYAPHSYATFATSVAPHGNARPPPRHAEASMLIAAKIVRVDPAGGSR